MTDKEKWINHPKLNWVYNTCDLLTKQNKPWKPFRTYEFNTALNIFNLDYYPNGTIWIQEPTKRYNVTITINKDKIEIIDEEYIPGELSLVIHGFVLRHLKSYVGTVHMTIIDSTIISITLA